MSRTKITPQALYNKFKEAYPRYDCNFNRFQTGCAVARYYQAGNELGRFPEFGHVDEWVYNFTAVYSVVAINGKHTLEYSEWRSTDEGKIAVVNFYKEYQHLAENGPFDFHVKGFDLGQIMWTDVIGWKGLAVIEEAGSNIVMAVYETLRMVQEYEEQEELEVEVEVDTPEGKGLVKHLKDNTEGDEDDGNDENDEKDRKRGRRSAANPFDDGPAQSTRSRSQPPASVVKHPRQVQLERKSMTKVSLKKICKSDAKRYAPYTALSKQKLIQHMLTREGITYVGDSDD